MKWGPLLLVVSSAACAFACATPVSDAQRRAFDWERDIFAHPNQLYWQYEFDEETGEQVGRPRDEPVEFGQRCMTMSRGVRQFWRAARFDADLPVADDETYRELVRAVFATDPRDPDPAETIVIPGYPDLRRFSRAHEALVKDETPGGWRSYVQRGNWRMFFAFFDFQQRQTAEELVAALERGDLPIIRVVRFPNITINHAVLVFDAVEAEEEIIFLAYDPNHIEAPLRFLFDRESESFVWPPRNYYLGGYVSVYRAYDGWLR